MPEKKTVKETIPLTINLYGYKSTTYTTHSCYYCKKDFKLLSGEMLYTDGDKKNKKVFCSYNCRCKYRKQKEESN